MRSSNLPELVLVVSTQVAKPRRWVLEPEGRNTFKIVVVCCPQKRLEAV